MIKLTLILYRFRYWRWGIYVKIFSRLSWYFSTRSSKYCEKRIDLLGKIVSLNDIAAREEKIKVVTELSMEDVIEQLTDPNQNGHFFNPPAAIFKNN